MATVIQKLKNTVNIIIDTKPVGEQILLSLSTYCVAKPINKDPNNDVVQFLDEQGMPTASVTLDGTLKVHDYLGSAVLWVGTLDDFITKMNDEYFNNSVSDNGGGILPIGASTETKQDTQITALANLLTELQLKADLSDTQPVSASSMITEIQTTGLWRGKTAYVYNILGRRRGFTSTSIINGVKEYDNAVADFAITSNSTLDVISSNVNDTTGGTGARTIKVTYINSSNNLVQSPAIALNGTTLVTNVLTGVNQVLWAEVDTVGSSLVSAGNIRLRINGGVVEVEQITAGGNRSKSGIFMIPQGYTGYVTAFYVSAVNNDQDVKLRGQVFSFDRSFSSVYHFMAETYAPLDVSAPPKDGFFRMPELSMVNAGTISGGTGGTVRCNVNFLVIIVQN